MSNKRRVRIIDDSDSDEDVASIPKEVVAPPKEEKKQQPTTVMSMSSDEEDEADQAPLVKKKKRRLRKGKATGLLDEDDLMLIQESAQVSPPSKRLKGTEQLEEVDDYSEAGSSADEMGGFLVDDDIDLSTAQGRAVEKERRRIRRKKNRQAKEAAKAGFIVLEDDKTKENHSKYQELFAYEPGEFDDDLDMAEDEEDDLDYDPDKPEEEDEEQEVVEHQLGEVSVDELNRQKKRTAEALAMVAPEERSKLFLTPEDEDIRKTDRAERYQVAKPILVNASVYEEMSYELAWICHQMNPLNDPSLPNSLAIGKNSTFF